MTTTIFKARKIITMNPRQPTATHVAVRDGWILGAGALEDLTGWGEHTIDDRFDGLVLMPGMVEGHCHSWEGSAWEDPYLGFYDRLASGMIAPHSAFLECGEFALASVSPESFVSIEPGK